MERALLVELPGGGRSVRIATPEDTALRKLWWYREGGEVSDRQWRDVLGVLRQLGGAAEEEYLVKSAGALGVLDLLDRARREC